MFHEKQVFAALETCMDRTNVRKTLVQNIYRFENAPTPKQKKHQFTDVQQTPPKWFKQQAEVKVQRSGCSWEFNQFHFDSVEFQPQTAV